MARFMVLFRITGGQLLAISGWLLAVGIWHLAISNWLLAAGYSIAFG